MPDALDINYAKFKPEDVLSSQRNLHRIPVRENEGVKAIVSIPGNMGTYECNVVDMSSMGFGLESEESVIHPPEKGDLIDLSISCRDDSYRMRCVVCHVTPIKLNRIRLGLMSTETVHEIQKAPPHNRISLTATTGHPYYFNENVVLKLIDISQDDCVLECDDPEFLVFPFMSISLALHISSGSQDEIHGSVIWVETPGQGKTRFGMKIQKITEKTKKAIVRHLFQLHDWKPRELREMGFTFKGYRPLIKFRSLRTHNEYLEVLKLRRNAYLSAKKIGPDSKDTDLASELDRKSRILVAYHQDKLVGTVALLFPDREDMLMDTEKTFENGYPVALPPKTNMIEIARLCITPDYRSTDILWGMIEHIYRIMITAGRDYIISSTDDHMWTLYRQMGFKKLGVSYDHPVLKGIEHHIMLLHKNSALFGKGVSPFVWKKLYGDMTEYLRDIDAVHLNLYQRTRIRWNTSLFSLLRFYFSIFK